MAQDDYYYEIQLSNKQLVFYFMAGATGLILSFLAGIMVGRGVDANVGEVQAARAMPVQEEKVVAEEPPKSAPPAAEDLTYAQRLEADKQEDTLEKAKPAFRSPAKSPGAVRPAPAKPAPGVAPPALHPATAATSAPKPTATTPAPKQASPSATSPAPAKPGPAPKAVAPTAGTFTIQVGAFKDRATADSIVTSLKGKGFAAYVVPLAAEGLFNVRVGSYASRADAEHIQLRLRDEQNFKPYIRKN